MLGLGSGRKKGLSAPLVIAGVVGIGLLLDKFVFNRNTPETPPEPTTPETPALPPAKNIALSSAQISRLQTALINLGWLTAQGAKGGWGSISEGALKSFTPTNYKNLGKLTSNNYSKYLSIAEDAVARKAKEQAELKTKQNSQAENIALAKKLEENVNSGKYYAQLLNDVSSVMHIYDNLTKSYRVDSSKTRKFSKGETFESGEMIARGNGQIFIKKNLERYPVMPLNFVLIAK